MEQMKVGMPLQLEINNGTREEKETYQCKLVDFKNGYLYIDYPIHLHTRRTGFFMDGTQMEASFVGDDQSVYLFVTEVVARRKLTIPVIVLSFPGYDKMVRIQRRRYVRVETAADVAIQREGQSFSTVTFDISGGGVAIIPPRGQEFKEQEKLSITLVLPMNSGEYHYIEAVGSVRRMIEAKKTAPRKISVEFEKLEENHRQKIIQYCFEKQMDERKRARQ